MNRIKQIPRQALKLSLSAALLFLPLRPITAAADAKDDLSQSETLRIERLINSGLERHSADIQIEAARLELAVREQLYADKHKEAWVPMFVNLFLSLGVGSALQGDIEGFVWELGAEMLGTLILSASVIGAFQTYTPVMGPDGPQPRPEAPAGMGAVFGAGALLGSGLIMGGKIYGLVRPFSYANAYNQQLSEALLLKESGPISLIPLPDASGLQLSWRF